MKSLNCSYEKSFLFFPRTEVELVHNEQNDCLMADCSRRRVCSRNGTNYSPDITFNVEKNNLLQTYADDCDEDALTSSGIVSFSSSKRESPETNKNQDISESRVIPENSFLSRDPYEDLKFISAIQMDFTLEDVISHTNSRLPKKPFKVVEAPDMENDFYKQLLHWSPSNNKIAIGLSNSVYLWDCPTQTAEFLCEFAGPEELCSVKWDAQAGRLAFGMSSGEIKLWDVKKNTRIRDLTSHTARVGCIDWNETGLFSGSKKGVIVRNDERAKRSIVEDFRKHRGQVLNVKCARFGQSRLLSAGNDSQVIVIDFRNPKRGVMQESHEGAVRAIEWSPSSRNQFVSGGGSADKTLKVWDLSRNEVINEVFAGAQICDIKCSNSRDEVLLATGGESKSVDIYRLSRLSRVGRLEGHSKRVINIDFSSDCSQLVSASSDETLRFWKMD